MAVKLTAFDNEVDQINFEDAQRTGVSRYIGDVVLPGEGAEKPATVSKAPAAQPGQTDAGLSKAFLGGVDRTSVDHKLLIGDVDYSSYVTSINVKEKVDADIEATLTLENQQSILPLVAAADPIRKDVPFGEFILNDRRELSSGYVVKLSLFDGQRWRRFGELRVVDITRDYKESMTIKLTCRSGAIDLQFDEKSASWSDKTDSEVVTEIAVANGFTPDVQETTHISEDRTIGNEALSQFLNKLAQQNGFEWGVDGKRLFFKEPAATKTDITLEYRPRGTSIGSILSATYKKQEDSKTGSESEAKVGATDFDQGTVDPDTVQETAEQQRGEYPTREPSGTTRTKQPDVLRTDVTDGESGRTAKIQIDDEGIPGTYSRIKKGEVHHSDVARSKEEADQLADNLDRTNAYKHLLTIRTYGQEDLRIRSIINVQGLAVQDNGKWFIDGVEHEYTASNAYRMTLEAKAPEKADGSRADANPQDFIKPRKETERSVVVLDDEGIPGTISKRPARLYVREDEDTVFR